MPAIKFVKTFRLRYHKAEEAFARLPKRIRAKTPSPNWKTIIIDGIANEMRRFFPHQNIEVLGPAGLYAACWICVGAAGAQDTKSIILIPGDLTKTASLSIRDHTRKLDRFPENSIGALNGGNFPEIPIPEVATIEWLATQIR